MWWYQRGSQKQSFEQGQTYWPRKKDKNNTKAYVKCSVLGGLAMPVPIPTPLVAPTVIMFEMGALITFELA